MQYLNESYFRNVFGNLSLNERQQTFSANDYETFDVFISYNIHDKEVVRGIYYFLKKKGYKVYVDFIVDPDLDRSSVTKETAERIQRRLKHSKSLIYALSPSAATSKWMPWELGVVDGKTDKCFIMPVLPYSYSKGFKRQEFLLLYPVIGLSSFDGLRIFDAEDSVYGRTLYECIK